jgi:hypothetical protein
MTHYACASQSDLHLCRDAFETAVQKHLALQSAVLASLPQDQDILHVKSLQEWHDILQSPRNNTITVDAYDGNLAAQSIAIHPLCNDSIKDVDMLDMDLPDVPHKLSTFCAVMTHPQHRGQHLMQCMMDEWKQIAARDNRSHLLGCITRSNVQSWSQFLKAGLVITGAGFDPSDNSTVYYAHRDAQAPVYWDMADIRIVSDETNLSQVQELLHAGYVGVEAERKEAQYTKRLIMARRL